MYRKMNSQLSSEYSDDPQSPLSESKTHVNTHSTKTGPSCGTRCVVCSDIAPPNTVFRRHYGVICCEACKCFFRRTVQMGRDYKCRFGNNCPVGRTAVNMKQVCQACRFQTCTRAGMKIESVKKFPRKSKDPDYTKTTIINNNNSSNNSPLNSGTARCTEKEILVNKITIKKEPVTHKSPPLAHDHNRRSQSLDTSAHSLPNRNTDTKLSDGDFDYESEFEQFKFNISSPDLSLYHSALDSTIPKLFSGESLENIHEKSSIPTPESISGENNDKSPYDKTKGSPGRLTSITRQPSPLVVTRVSGTNRSSTNTDTMHILPEVSTLIADTKIDSERGISPTFEIPTIQLVQSGEEKTGRELANIMQENSKQGKKRGGNNEIVNLKDMLAKKIRLEEALNNINARQAQVKANLVRLSGGYNTNNTNNTITSSSQLVMSSYGHQSIVVPTSQDPIMCQSPYTTPHGTPAPSPLPSPCLVSAMPPTSIMNQAHHSYPSSPHPLSTQNMSQPGTPINCNSLPTSPGYSNQQTQANHIYFSTSSPQGTVFFNSQVPPQMMYQQQQQHPIIPALVHIPHSGYNTHNSSQLPSPHQQIPFSSFNFPNQVHNNTGPSPSKGDGGSQLPSPSLTHDSEGKLSMEIPEGSEHEFRTTPRGSISAPPSACPSPITKPSRTLASNAPEAEVEEVLGSLKLRILRMFKWARSEVEDFEDLSPLDQKALLRRTVSELIMLGFARASIPYDGMLILGSTGKVIRNNNGNPGVAAVAMVTLSKLVIPLKVLNIDDKELSLMQEIILFNPESNGLYNREIVRQYRRRKHLELLEYTEKYEPGRFGELMCLLTPLYEVSLEVTEQLRLEQFVHEGENRIDALLLMSMINQGGGTVDEPIEDSAGKLI